MKRQVEIENTIKVIIERQNLAVSPDFVIDYWAAKNWKTKQGHPVKSFEVAVHVCNSIYLTRLRKPKPLQLSLL